MAKIDNLGSPESSEEQSSRTVLSVLRECKAGRLANTIAAVKLFALSLLPAPGCDEGTREEYMHADAAEMTDIADIADADSCDGTDIGPDSCDGIDIGSDSCDGIDIGPDSCDGADVGPDATMSCNYAPHDGEYGCNDGCIAVGVRCGDDYTPVDVCVDDVQAIMDECADDSTTPLSVHCGNNPECNPHDFDGAYGCDDGCHAVAMLCEDANGQFENIDVNLCGGETPLVCPDGCESVAVFCR